MTPAAAPTAITVWSPATRGAPSAPVTASLGKRGRAGGPKQSAVPRLSPVPMYGVGFCGECRLVRPLSEMYKRVINGHTYYNRCRDCRKRITGEFQKARRTKLAAVVGSECAACGAPDGLVICSKSGASLKASFGNGARAVKYYLDNAQKARADLCLLCCRCRNNRVKPELYRVATSRETKKSIMRRSLAAKGMGFCGACRLTLPLSDMAKERGGQRYRDLCRDCNNGRLRAHFSRRRRQLADIIGDRCAQCGAQDRLTVCTKSGAGMKERHGSDYRAVTYYLGNVPEARASLRLLCVSCRSSAYGFKSVSSRCHGRCDRERDTKEAGV